MSGSTGTAERYGKSLAAHEAARRVMPGGVSSPVRAYKAVGRSPVSVASGSGAWITDVDGNRYVDYVMSYGPLMLGHCPQAITAAVTKALRHGSTFGMPTELETTLARRVVELVPSVEVVRFVSSGTEAAMSAIRLARAATGRSKIIKCTGCYHGHSDALLVQAGSAATTLGTPSSPGVPATITQHTLLVPFNNLAAVESAMKQHPGEVAAMCVEPIAGNMGLVPPLPGYLQGLRTLCDEHGVVLLFDEVMTGFRVALGGAQALYGVTPDVTCLGKVIGGGLPCAAYGGREDIMRRVAPDGPVYQAGTLSGNPLAMAAGIAMLDALEEDAGNAFALLDAASEKLVSGLERAAKQAGCPAYFTRVGSMVGVFLVDQHGQRVDNYEDATATRTDRYAAFFNVMLDHGVMLAPAAFEAWFVSTAHDEEAIQHTLAAAGQAFAAAAQLA